MAWTQQTGASAVGANLSLSVTAGDLIVVGHQFEDITSNPTISDGGVNTYAQCGSIDRNGVGDSAIMWCAVAATTATLTIAVTNTAGAYRQGAGTFRNGTLQASPFHDSHGQDAGASTATDGNTSGTFATTAGDLMVGITVDTVSVPAANWAAAGTNFTILAAANIQNGTDPAFGFEYNLNAAGGNLAATFTDATIDGALTKGASFTAQAAGGDTLMGQAVL